MFLPRTRRFWWLTLLVLAALALGIGVSVHRAQEPARADSRHVGGEPESIVQVANLVYAGTKSSHCFSDHFLARAEKESAISTSRRFHAAKLASDEIFSFPLVIMTGEGGFQ